MKWRVASFLLLSVAVVYPVMLFGQTFIWTQTSAPIIGWTGIASSADGTKIAACSDYPTSAVYTSTNAGVSWTKVANPTLINPWSSGQLISIASSTDGMHLVVGSQTSYSSTNSGYVYTSADSGVTWKETSAPWENWYSIASSANGTNIFAAGSYQVWGSTNAGQSWDFHTPAVSPPTPYWNKVACSTDGTKILASSFFKLYTSTNSGLNWNLTTMTNKYWRSLASSSDGTKLIAGNDQNTGLVFISTNSGISWAPTSAPSNTYWSAITSSADGTKLAALANNDPASSSGSIYNSTNSGLSWTANSFPNAYVNSMVSSSDGTKLFAAFNNVGIFVGQLIVPAQNFSAVVTVSGVKLQFSGAPRCAYVLESATNLTFPVSWQPVFTNSTDANGNWSFIDTNSGQHFQRFFRASQ